jgi:hypothetical protein
MSEMKPPRHIGRSIGALFAGFLVGAGLSLGTDEILHIAAIYPPWGQTMTDALFLLERCGRRGDVEPRARAPLVFNRGCGNRDAVRMGGREAPPCAVVCTVSALRSSCF